MSLYSRYHAISDERWLQLLAGATAPGNSLSEVLRGLFAAGRWGAVVSERYVDRHWPAQLTKRLFDQQILPQALIVAQKTV